MSEYVHHWTGFYSTRPVLKQQIRNLSDKFKSISKLHALQTILNANFEYYDEKMESIERATSILMHHDAITGTHSLTAKRDYIERIAQNDKTMDEITIKIMDDLEEVDLDEGNDRLKEVV